MKQWRIVDVSECEDFSLYQDDLLRIYKRAFGEPPWNEVFTREEVLEWFSEMMLCPGRIVLVMYFKEKVVGGTFCTNANLEHDVWQYLPPNIKRHEVIYLAESFIDPVYQRQGLGGVLHDYRLNSARKQGYRYVLERTSEDSGMFYLIQRTGFKKIGRQIVNSRKKINGVIKECPDERIISLKKL